ncbi:hypothetical protein PO306_16110, partial [Bacteroides ovatus]|uniref:hypothetical protein n=1 Tax=Bacteroides ovatus TaxID=28116 RepID=UPI00233EDAC2
CGSECRRFESGLPPNKNPCKLNTYEGFLLSGGGHSGAKFGSKRLLYEVFVGLLLFPRKPI